MVQNKKPPQKSSGGSAVAGLAMAVLLGSQVLPQLYRRGKAAAIFLVVIWVLMAILVVALKIKKTRQEEASRSEGRPQGRKTAHIQELREVQKVRGPSNAGEGHVPTIGMTVQAKLEQLETLRQAGLLEPEEYSTKRQKILSGK